MRYGSTVRRFYFCQSGSSYSIKHRPAGGNGVGVLGKSTNGEGVHGETSSTTFAAVAGIQLNSTSNVAAVYGEQRGNGPGVYGIAKGNGGGVFGTSANGEGVHGETNSTTFAAVAGIEGRSASWPYPGAGNWQREQTAAEPLRGRTATSMLFLSALKWACWYTKPRSRWQRFRIVISSMARKRVGTKPLP